MRKLPALTLNPVSAVVDAARRYRSRAGITSRDAWDYSRVVVTPEGVTTVSKAYMSLPAVGNSAREAWGALAEETARQFDFMTAPASKGGLGLTVTLEDTDPYPGSDCSRAFLADIADGRIRVLRQTENFLMHGDAPSMLRAVHDVFGHGGTGRGVDRHGEEAAYRKHAGLYSPLARRALATEQRGRNLAMIAHGEYQSDRFAILPLSARDFSAVAPTTREAFTAAFKHAAKLHNAQKI